MITLSLAAGSLSLTCLVVEQSQEEWWKMKRRDSFSSFPGNILYGGEKGRNQLHSVASTVGERRRKSRVQCSSKFCKQRTTRIIFPTYKLTKHKLRDSCIYFAHNCHTNLINNVLLHSFFLCTDSPQQPPPPPATRPRPRRRKQKAVAAEIIFGWGPPTLSPLILRLRH